MNRRSLKIVTLLSLLMLLLVVGSPAVVQQYSELWGVNGELWTPQNRLPDFSFAGYHSGNAPIPTVPVVANVRDYGAVGNGTTDDTQAFRNAIAAVSSGAISIPAGRYKITQPLQINKSNVVLRGAGAGSTTLYFPNSLRDMLGPAPEWAGGSGLWSWGGGVIWVAGSDTDTGVKLSDVTVPALRGDRQLTLSSAASISVGSTIRLVQIDPSDDSLGLHLHADYFNAGQGPTIAAAGRFVDWAVKVTAKSGNTITLERPLRQDVRMAWQPQILSYVQSVKEVGLEEFTIEFPNTQYNGHFTEAGYNGIYFHNVHDSWVRNVTIVDADSGFLTNPPVFSPFITSRFCTIQGLRLMNRWRSTSITGHHGIALEGPNDFLITNFSFDTKFLHDLTLDANANGNVFSAGRGDNLNFDHHTGLPYENLFTQIDAGAGARLWESSGPSDGGPHSGARSTFWNIVAPSAPSLPTDWPQMTVVGMTQYGTTKSNYLWTENIDPNALAPSNIYLAQLARRLGNSPPTSPTSSVGVSFQPAGSPTYLGYLVDSGSVYGVRDNGYSYGWNAAAETRDRNSSLSPDERYDRFAIMGNAVWEMAMPNGSYTVHLVVGDADWGDVSSKLTVEGVMAINGNTSNTARWLEGTLTVSVNDGRLTIGNLAGSYNKICYIDISSLATNSPPSVSMNSPANGASFAAPANIAIAANASDTDGTVVKVEFFQGAVKLGEDLSGGDGWGFNWNSVPSGSYSLTARATDNGGTATTSNPVNITVNTPADTTPPVISSQSALGITNTSATISWTTNEASDSQVDYGPTTPYGNSTTLNPSMVTSHSRALNGLAAGTTYNYRVKSADAAGNLAMSGNFVFTTTAGAPPPSSTVNINFQPPGSPTYPGYLVDSGSVYGSRGNGYSYGWNAVAETRDRNSALSPDQRYDRFAIMGNAVWEMAMPNGNYAVHVAVGDPDWADVISKLTVEGVMAINGNTSNTTRWLEGTLTVTVNDGRLTLGNLAGSYNKICFINITSLASPPSVSITSPANGASFAAPANITIAANASDADGTVVKVEFFQGAVKLGEDLSGGDGWGLNWNSVPSGSYSLTARATDNGGTATTSSPVNITTTGTPPSSSTVNINFQPPGSPAYPGYLVDSGSVYGSRGNGYSYGWNAAAETRDRNSALSPDQRYDRFAIMGNAVWEMAMPNGSYTVHVVVGDADWGDVSSKLTVEGVMAINGNTNTTTRWLEGTLTVTVNDGRLTISNLAGSYNKICFIDISSNETTPPTPPTPPTSGTAGINFQPTGTPAYPGYMADNGSVYGVRGNGYSYGWSADVATRDRDNALSPDQRYDTFAVMGNNVWEMAVPNGSYTVHVVVGDADWADVISKLTVEGVMAINGNTDTTTRWLQGTVTVTVNDGRLTLGNLAGSYNKICFIDISSLETTPPPSGAAGINFQPAGTLAHAGYMADNGSVYGVRGNGYSYGWSADVASRDRDNALSLDQRYDTFAVMGNNVWEMAVPNGSYTVHVVVGDADWGDVISKLTVEGVMAINGNTDTTTRWLQGTVTVTVNDGRLTLGNLAGSYNKICYIDISAQP